MKKTLFLVLAVLLWRPVPGQGLVPKPIPCFEPKIFTPAFDPGSNPKIDFKAYNCVDMFSADTVNTIDKGRTDLVAGKYIHIGPGAHIGPLPDPVTPESDPHYFHAYIGENDFEVVWFEPNETPGYVGQFEKLELGIKLPFPLDSMVYNYVHHNMTSTIEWLNPFDPLGINVEAKFTYHGGTYNQSNVVMSRTVYGFYYREFERNIVSTASDSIQYNNWNEDTTNYPFHIRFAPFAVGQWSVTIKIETPVGDYECLPITFECTPSGNPGFIRVGDNHLFMQQGNETFFPVGTNLPHPTCWECYAPNTDGFEAYGHEPMKSLGFVKYHTELTDLKNKGGNYFRMLLAPWATDIEFEHVNNYSDRMNYAWEVDRILDTIKDLDLFMHFNLQFHYTLENPTHYNMWFWDWEANGLDTHDPSHLTEGPDPYTWPDPGYAYQYELGLTDPIEFYTDSNAIRHYKNKLRYMISRWAYSTHIAVWELYSEIDNTASVNTKQVVVDTSRTTGYGIENVGNAYKPYWREADVPPIIEGWQTEMARYIKEDLQEQQHLVCANYTYGSGAGERVNNLTRDAADPRYPGADVYLDSTYFSENIDLMSWNQYPGYGMNRFFNLADTEFPNRFSGKPILFSETNSNGAINVEDCDNDAEFIRTLWCTAFSGAAGPGLDYNSRSHDFYGTWNHFGTLRDFIDHYDFASALWFPDFDLMGDADPNIPGDSTSDHQDAEMFALVNRDTDDEAIGVISSRRYNFFTTSSVGTACHNEGLIDNDDYENVANIESAFWHPLKLHQMDVGDYVIVYYNAFTGQITGASTASVLPVIKTLTLQDWQLCMFDCDYNEDEVPDTPQPLVAFKVIKAGMRLSPALVLDSIMTANNKEELGFALYPNPAGQGVNLAGSMLSTLDNMVTILNSSGQVVYQSRTETSMLNIDVSNFQSGIYLVTLQNGQQVQTKRLIVQHEKH